MINIIIPAYNAHLTIERAIMSIVSQTVKDLISIIIVNDGSKRDYSFLVKKYSPEIKIKEIKNELNLGVGITRQKGIDEVDQPYFAFMDSDDNYINNKIVEKALSVFEKQKEIVLISCNFIEENKWKQQTRVNSIKGFHGKFYRTDFIKKNNILVPNTRVSEDTLFNRFLILFLENKLDRIKSLNEDAYFWRHRNNSLSSIFNSNDWQKDYIRANIYLSKKIKIKKEILNEHFIDSFFLIYVSFLKDYNNQINDQETINLMKTYYHNFIEPQKINFTEDFIKNKVKIVSSNEYLKKHISFLNFIKLLNNQGF